MGGVHTSERLLEVPRLLRNVHCTDAFAGDRTPLAYSSVRGCVWSVLLRTVGDRQTYTNAARLCCW